MGEVINLRQARKAKARAEEEERRRRGTAPASAAPGRRSGATPTRPSATPAGTRATASTADEDPDGGAA